MFIAKLPGVSGVFRIMLMAVMLAVSAGCQNQNRLIVLDGIKAGAVITFGRYPQTASGEIKPIEWRVLEVKGNKALLLADKGLDSAPYTFTQRDSTWETSSIRGWLNSYFLSTAFTDSEEYSIDETVIKNPDNLECGTRGGYDTRDRIFLLSLDEVRWYFNQDGAERISRVPYAVNGGILRPTPYAVKKGVWVSDKLQSSHWWLRSPGSYQNWASFVFENGMLGFYGESTNNTRYAVRPALWVRFETSNQ